MHPNDAIILGLVEGISEFLPISSTGHLMLTARLLHIPVTDFLKSFEIAIQLGAIASVVMLYFKSLFLDIQMIKKICVAFIPTGIVGLILYKMIKKYLLGNTDVVVWSLLLGGIFLIVFELVHSEAKDGEHNLSCISYRQALLIGVFQSLAIIPGVSRSAATIIGGLLLGVKRKTIVEFSFLLAVPTMLAATLFDLSKSAIAFSGNEISLLVIGSLVSFVIASVAIQFFLSFIARHNFIFFGVYRIIAAVLFWIYIH